MNSLSFNLVLTTGSKRCVSLLADEDASSLFDESDEISKRGCEIQKPAQDAASITKLNLAADEDISDLADVIADKPVKEMPLEIQKEIEAWDQVRLRLASLYCDTKVQGNYHFTDRIGAWSYKEIYTYSEIQLRSFKSRLNTSNSSHSIMDGNCNLLLWSLETLLERYEGSFSRFHKLWDSVDSAVVYIQELTRDFESKDPKEVYSQLKGFKQAFEHCFLKDLRENLKRDVSKIQSQVLATKGYARGLDGSSPSDDEERTVSFPCFSTRTFIDLDVNEFERARQFYETYFAVLDAHNLYFSKFHQACFLLMDEIAQPLEKVETLLSKIEEDFGVAKDETAHKSKRLKTVPR